MLDKLLVTGRLSSSWHVLPVLSWHAPNLSSLISHLIKTASMSHGSSLTTRLLGDEGRSLAASDTPEVSEEREAQACSRHILLGDDRGADSGLWEETCERGLAKRPTVEKRDKKTASHWRKWHVTFKVITVNGAVLLFCSDLVGSAGGEGWTESSLQPVEEEDALDSSKAHQWRRSWGSGVNQLSEAEPDVGHLFINVLITSVRHRPLHQCADHLSEAQTSSSMCWSPQWGTDLFINVNSCFYHVFQSFNYLLCWQHPCVWHFTQQHDESKCFKVQFYIHPVHVQHFLYEKVQYLAQGHFGKRTREGWDRTPDLLVGGGPLQWNAVELSYH